MRKLLFVLAGLIGIVLVVGIVLLAIGYQPTVYLMPTPAVMSTGDHNPFDLNPNLEKSNELRVLFATNRVPAGVADDRTYTIFPGNKLRMGIAHMRIGTDETTWEKIFSLSTSADPGSRPALRLEEIHELVKYPLGNDVSSSSARNQVLADAVNRELKRSINKDIMVYVHGANTSIYRALAQAAQYHHFTGQNAVVLAFLWPSAENLFGYGTDTRHARKSAPAFAMLLNLLARHTDAENINILAYSSGAQIASPALDLMGRHTAKVMRKKLRIGQVYFAAADIGVVTFVEHLQNYFDIPRSTTLALNLNDSVLALSARRNRESRAGSPDTADLSDEQFQWVQKAAAGPALSAIQVSADTVSGMRSRSHDFWYSHPWVSSDVLAQFLFHVAPGDRGLQENREDNKPRYWTFPPDYPERIVGIVSAVAGKEKPKTH